MATKPTTAGRSLPALLTVVAVALVFGIIGMHALNTHGIMGNPTGGIDDGTMAMSADPGTYAISAMTGAHAGGTSSLVATASPEGGTGHDMASMVMLCVAMLTAAAWSLLLALYLVRRRPHIWAHLPAIGPATFQPFTAPRGAGPPPTWEFSVVRC